MNNLPVTLQLEPSDRSCLSSAQFPSYTRAVVKLVDIFLLTIHVNSRRSRVCE